MIEFYQEAAIKDNSTLLIRTPKEEDAEMILAYLFVIGGESDNLLFGEGEFSMSLEQEREYIKSRLTDPNILWLMGFINGSLVSMGHIGCLNRPRNRHNADLSLTVKKEFWGKGIAQAMMAELLRFAKEHEGIKNVHLGVRAGNDAAIHIYEKFGFQKVGTHKNYFCVNGVYHDLNLMDLNL